MSPEFLRHPALLTLGGLGVVGIGFRYSEPVRQFGKDRRALSTGGPAHNLQSHGDVSTVSYGRKRPFARKARGRGGREDAFLSRRRISVGAKPRNHRRRPTFNRRPEGPLAGLAPTTASTL